VLNTLVSSLQLREEMRELSKNLQEERSLYQVLLY
jgi:hypothetical protein